MWIRFDKAHIQSSKKTAWKVNGSCCNSDREAWKMKGEKYGEIFQKEKCKERSLGYIKNDSQEDKR